jgi:tetratricopeptide (TPR) repeat protein
MVALKPNDTLNHFVVVDAMMECGHYQDAERYVELALDVYPFDHYAVYLKGNVVYAIRGPEQAIPYYL